MAEVSIPLNAATLSFTIILITNLIVLVAGYTNLKRDSAANRETSKNLAIKISEVSNRYDTHASNSGIHQESMSREAIMLNMGAITSQIANVHSALQQHSKEDMDVFKEIKEDLKEIRIISERRRVTD